MECNKLMSVSVLILVSDLEIFNLVDPASSATLAVEAKPCMLVLRDCGELIIPVSHSERLVITSEKLALVTDAGSSPRDDTSLLAAVLSVPTAGIARCRPPRVTGN